MTAPWSWRPVALSVFARMPGRCKDFVVHRVSPTYSMGALVVVIDGNDILLVQHSYKRGWGLPGGIANRHELPESVAVRELREEVGVDVELVGEPTICVDAARHILNVVFAARLARATDRDLVRPTPPELTAAQWFGLNALPIVQADVPMAVSRLRAMGLLPGPAVSPPE